MIEVGLQGRTNVDVTSAILRVYRAEYRTAQVQYGIRTVLPRQHHNLASTVEHEKQLGTTDEYN